MERGIVIQILGPVIDVRVEGKLPLIGDLLEVATMYDGEEEIIELEVSAILEDIDTVRTIALSLTDGIVRGQNVKLKRGK